RLWAGVADRRGRLLANVVNIPQLPGGGCRLPGGRERDAVHWPQRPAAATRVYAGPPLDDLQQRRAARRQRQRSAEPTVLRPADGLPPGPRMGDRDRKSTRLNSSHVSISYAVFCLKKKKKQ